MKEHGICAKCKKSVGCPYADDRIKGCKKFVLEDELKLTNEEWLRQCTTEQLAEVIGNIAKNAYQCCQDGKTNKCVNRHNCTGYCNYGWEMWLKQPHKQGVAEL
jgi:hypothetical protein